MVAQETKGSSSYLEDIYNKYNYGKEEFTPKWARRNKSRCCGATILFYGDDYKGFCPECGRDL